jgi:IS30 family transposase
VASKHADVVTEATIFLLKPHLNKTLTITADNGKEFASHQRIRSCLAKRFLLKSRIFDDKLRNGVQK